MSLILTKSTPGHPASYVNRFKNTFEIKSNAEIAVQEVVLNRSSKFVVGPDARLSPPVAGTQPFRRFF